MPRQPYIAIEGVIGVGKTTLARLLQPELGGELLLEEFEENPFLSDFYADRQRYAFQTQIFFLLSRYRQQVSKLPPAMRRGAVISDYTFAKDRLFAGITLSGDEFAMYQRVHDALGEQIPTPDLLVFLRADLDVLMARIAARDRPYERGMDAVYIDQVRLAYEDFIASYEDAPVLAIDTNDLNIVQHKDDLASVARRVKSSLEYGTYQAQLPGVEGLARHKPQVILEEFEFGPRRMRDYQSFHLSLDVEKGFDPDLYLNFIGLSEELGEMATAFKRTWLASERLRAEGHPPGAAHEAALDEFRPAVENELADCLAYLFKLSNYAGVDLEGAYLEKMALNARRVWRDGRIVEEGDGG